MVRNRSIRELLEIMYHYRDLLESEKGLCTFVCLLYSMKVIDFSEAKKLGEYIRDNKPQMFSSLEAFQHKIKNPVSAYYWEPGKAKPRIKWIEDHIEKNSNKHESVEIETPEY